MEVSRFRVSKRECALLVLTFLIDFSGFTVSAAGNGRGGSDETSDRCNVDLSTFIPLPYSDSSNMVCTPVWNTFVIQYSQNKDHIVSILLSAAYTTGWVGMAFSKDGMMLNSSAVVGWISKEGQTHIKQYYLKGFEQLDVIPDKGDLPLTNVPKYVVLRGATIYIAFQLNFSAPLGLQPVLLAFGSKYPTKLHHLHPHDDKTSIVFDFSAGSVTVSAAPDKIGQTKRTHGILGLIGWGLFLPYGAITARYFKHHDPLWFYVHAGIQFVGSILGFAGILFGVSLYNEINAQFPTHRGIGIFVLVLSVLQILAFVARPEKDSKIRKYWNWYHHWVGRIALLFGNANIALGIQIGHAGNDWKAGYGFLLATVLIASIVLEVFVKEKEVTGYPSSISNELTPVSHVQEL